jgi:hypothetical protein
MSALLGLANRWKETGLIAGKYLTYKLTLTAGCQTEFIYQFYINRNSQFPVHFILL